MFLIWSPVKKNESILDIVEKFYQKRELIIQKYHVAGRKYLVCYTSPIEVLPYDIIKKIRFNEVKHLETKFFDKANIALPSDSLRKGMKVKIISGSLKGMKGQVKQVLSNEKVELIISVFGIPTIVEVEKDSLMLIEE